MKIIFNTLYYLTIGTVGIIGLLLIASMVPVPGNYEVKVVKSGSMEPAINVGGIVIIKPAPVYNVGDVITFGADTKTQIPTTHRIIAKEGEGSSATFQTKGDANNAPDPTTVRASEVHGKMLFTVPYLGYLLAFARTKMGFFMLVGVPALLVFYEEGMNIIREIKRMRTRKRRPAEREPEPMLAELPIPMKPQVHRIKVMSLVLIIGLTLGGALGASSYSGNTVAYYADTAISQGNKLGASAIFPSSARLFLDLSPLSVTVDDTVPVLEEGGEVLGTSTSENVVPPEQPTEEPAVVISEPVLVEPPAEDPPPAEATPEPQPEPTPAETPPATE